MIDELCELYFYESGMECSRLVIKMKDNVCIIILLLVVREEETRDDDFD